MKCFLLLSSLLILPMFAQANDNIGSGEIRASATIENSCLIAADNVNFGQVFAPLSTQGAQSQMKILCSKNASYTINLAYGGVYGSGTGSSVNYSATVFSSDGWDEKVKVFKGGVAISNSSYDLSCNRLYPGYIFFTSVEARTEYGYSGEFKSQELDTKKMCNGAYIDRSVLAVLGASQGYSYGVMNGGLKGDKLAYKITVPGDISKVWNAGNNAYTATGTGAEQVIEMNAQIVPGNSSSLYVAQDIYTDTVTAEVSY